MKRKRFSVEQIVAVLKQAELDLPVAELDPRGDQRNWPSYRAGPSDCGCPSQMTGAWPPWSLPSLPLAEVGLIDVRAHAP
jgi:hypothetical protein